MNKGGYRWRAALTIAALLLVAGVSAFAQLQTGTILGTVKDSSGGVVPGVTVRAESVETGQVRTATTGDDGGYRLPGLAVGHYTLRFEKTGFQASAQQGLNLEVTQELVVNIALGVGTEKQEIVVTGEAPVVNTTNGALGGLVNENQMTDLPLNGRNFLDLSLMETGVQKSIGVGDHVGTAGTYYSSNGAPIRSNNATLDGAILLNQYGGIVASQGGTTLGVDGIREYKVVTDTPSAEYGMQMGSQLVMVSKGGTNQFHGDVFEYLRNSSLDARNFFDTPADSGDKRLPEFRRNDFGGSLGGPIRKDKTFFYGVYEGLRQTLGFTAVDTTPFPAACFTANHIVGSACDSALAPGQTETVAPIAQPLLALFQPPTSGNTFSFPTNNLSSLDYGQIRVDQNVSASDTLFGRYTIQNGSLNNASSGGVVSTAAANTGPAWPFYRGLAASRDQFFTLGENHIFSTSVFNSARLSYTRTGFNDMVQDVNPVAPIPGFTFSLVPGGNISGITVSGFTPIGDPTYSINYHNIVTFGDDVFYTHGKHGLKFGFLFNHYADSLNDAVYITSPEETFQTPHAFLSGIPFTSVGLQPGSILDRYYLYDSIGFYAQDDWHTTSRLTLNLGLRYEFRTTPNEVNNRGYAFRNITDPTTTQGPIVTNPSKLDLSPRLGFAYDLSGKGTMSIRGGFGLYFDALTNIGSEMFWNVFGTPPLVTLGAALDLTNTPLSYPISLKQGTFVPVQAFTAQYNLPLSYTYEYNLTFERQLPGNVGLSVSYVGNRGIHTYTAVTANDAAPTSITNGIPFWNPALVSCESAPPTCRENPNFVAITSIAPAADSWYNALQVNVNKRLSRGLEFQAAYTYSHTTDTTDSSFGSLDCADDYGNGAAWGEYPQNLRLYDKGPACFDITNNLRLNLLYHFPNLKSSGFLSKIGNGWWIGNIVSIQSGYPFSPSLSTTTRSATGGSASRLDLVTTQTAGVGAASGLTFVPYNPNTVITGNPNQWFNPLMFQLPLPGYLGSAPRNDLRGPGLGEWDFSVVKDTPLPFLGEKASVEFRAEFFNFLNRANFGYPNMTVYAGTATDVSPFSEAPNPNAGQITTTATSSRQVQLALKIIF